MNKVRLFDDVGGIINTNDANMELILIFRNLQHADEGAKGHLEYLPQVYRFGVESCKGWFIQYKIYSEYIRGVGCSWL